jgi:hypothetical protein
MQAEDVSEQLTLEEDFKISKAEKKLLNRKASKIENDITHAVEQLRLTLLKRNYRNGFIKFIKIHLDCIRP